MSETVKIAIGTDQSEGIEAYVEVHHFGNRDMADFVIEALRGFYRLSGEFNELEIVTEVDSIA